MVVTLHVAPVKLVLMVYVRILVKKVNVVMKVFVMSVHAMKTVTVKRLQEFLNAALKMESVESVNVLAKRDVEMKSAA